MATSIYQDCTPTRNHLAEVYRGLSKRKMICTQLNYLPINSGVGK